MKKINEFIVAVHPNNRVMTILLNGEIFSVKLESEDDVQVVQLFINELKTKE